MGSSGQTMLAFQAGERRFAIPAVKVREVARVPRLTRVPQAPPSLLGLGNVRGEPIAVVSLPSLLGLPAVAPRQMILLAGDQGAALAVDRVEGIADDPDCELLDYASLLEGAYPARPESLGSVSARENGRGSGAGAREVGNERAVLLSFAVGDQRFALPIEAIEEVLAVPDDLARFPHCDAAILGTIVWRDRIVPAFLLSVLLGLPGASDSKSRLVIVRIGRGRAALLVESIQGLLRASRRRIDPVPVALLRDARSEAVIQAIVRPERGGRLVSLLAPEHLFREDIAARLILEQETHDGVGAGEDIAAGTGREALFLFESAGHRLALPLDAIRQVALMPDKVSPVPHAPAFLRGVASYRGEAHPVIDLGVQLGGAKTSGSKARMLVVTIAGGEAGLLVDSALGIKRLSPEDVVAAPPLSRLRSLDFDRVLVPAGETDHGGSLMLVVSPDDLFERIETEFLASLAAGSAPAA